MSQEVAKNPRNPAYNHYLFETVAGLVKHSCSNDPNQCTTFEGLLFPPFQLILEMDVTEFTEEMVADVRSLVDRTLGTLDVQIAPTAGVVEVDRVKLGRAVGNLLHQILGLTGQGEMTLTVDRVGVDGIDMLQFNLTHPELALDADTIKALLSDYTRPDQRALPQFARTGLGLVVTREFAELMGGDLLVQAANPGSSFLLRIPARVSAR